MTDGELIRALAVILSLYGVVRALKGEWSGALLSASIAVVALAT